MSREVQDEVSLAQGSYENGGESLCFIELGLEQDASKRPWIMKVVKREIKL
jgi:hypothetical protein